MMNKSFSVLLLGFLLLAGCNSNSVQHAADQAAEKQFLYESSVEGLWTGNCEEIHHLNEWMFPIPADDQDFRPAVRPVLNLNLPDSLSIRWKLMGRGCDETIDYMGDYTETASISEDQAIAGGSHTLALEWNKLSIYPSNIEFVIQLRETKFCGSDSWAGLDDRDVTACDQVHFPVSTSFEIMSASKESINVRLPGESSSRTFYKDPRNAN